MNYFLYVMTSASLLIPVILGYNLVFGRGKILNFGQIGVSIVSAYAIVIPLMVTGSYSMSIVSGLLCTAILSILFAWLALRLESDAFGILTIAMHLALYAVTLNWSDLTRGALGIPAIPRMPGLESLPAFAAASIAIASLWITFMYFIDSSPLGRALAALAENRPHAESLGISRSRTYLAAFLIAGLGSVLTNLLYPQFLGLLHPNDYRFESLVFLIMVCVAGRPGSVKGVVLSTYVLVFLKEGLRFVPLPYGLIGPLRLILFGLILIAAVYIRRKELFPKPRTI